MITSRMNFHRAWGSTLEPVSMGGGVSVICQR